MCQRYIIATAIDKIRDSFNVQSQKLKDWSPPIIVNPGSQSLIITQQNPIELTLSTFGMTPSWARSPMQLTNARAEGDKNPDNLPDFRGSKAIFLKKAFRKPLYHQRCIIIADAFLINSSNSSNNLNDLNSPNARRANPSNSPAPCLFFLKHHRHPIGLAGLYDIWHDNSTGDNLHSFTIITVAANSLVRKIGGTRMPVILPYKLESRWLKNELSLMEILSRLEKYPSKEMNAYPVSSLVNLPGPYTKEILNPTGNFMNNDKPFEPIKIQSYYGHKKHKEDYGHWRGNSPI